MRLRLLPVAAAALLTVSASTLPAGPAQAGVDCTPVIHTADTSFFPTTLAITSTGYKSLQTAGSFKAPCGKDNGSDLDAYVILSSPDIDGTLLINVSNGVYPTDGDHEYGIGETDHIVSGDLSNAWAGTWTTELDVTDSDDDPTHSYDDESGPSIQILRAAALTTNAAPEPVKKGKTITVTGKLTRANWDTGKDGAYAKKSVDLQFKPKGGSYAVVKTATSSSTGKLKAKVSATKDGYFRFVFAGSSTTAAVTSHSDYVNVT